VIVHRVLIIEDDPILAAVLAAMVASLGHEFVIARTLEEVRLRLAEGRYCYVLLDMQIPPVDGKDPEVGCGETALELVRKTDSSRTAEGKFRLPILVVTGYSRQPEFVARMFEKWDVAGFVAKPLPDAHEVVLDKIRGALRVAGRVEHETCEEQVNVRPADERATASEGSPAQGVSVVLDGGWAARKSTFLVNGQTCSLHDARFVVFLRLVVVHLRSPGTWSSRHTLGFPNNREMPSRVREAFAGLVPKDFEVIERNGNGSFRLNPELVIAKVNWAALARHPDEQVRKIAIENEKTLPVASPH
jgi:CheY-like chemotaxis protein